MKPLGIPADATVGANAADFEVTRIVEPLKALRVRAWRGPIDSGRRLLAQRLMRTLLVVFQTETIEASLLGLKVGIRRARRLFLKSAVHSFMTGVLLGMGWLDQDRQNAQPDPPDRQCRKPSHRDRGKGSAVVGANSPGKAVLFKQPLEAGPGRLRCAGSESLTAQQVPAHAVGNGQRIAVASITGSELPLKLAVHRSLGLSALLGLRPGCSSRRRKGRALIRPCRFRISPAVLAAGHVRSGL